VHVSLYRKVAELQGAQPWGSVLDAGTGRGSMRWLLSLPTARWTAVTGSSRMAEVTRQEIGDRMRVADRLIVGNWMDPELLSGESFDVVLADYLLGAVDGFAPYWQDQLFPRLRSLVGGRLYVVGLEPYVPYVPEDPAGRMVNEIGRLRDSCLLLSGDRPYREYPLDWVLRHLRGAGLRPVEVQRFPVRYGERFINSQLDLCTQSLDRLRDRSLAVALQAHVAGLRERALALASVEGGLRHGYDYLIAAEP
jgi:hypothetical protein